MNIRPSIRTFVFGTLLAASLQAQSATTDPGNTNIANAPMITNPTGSIMPNLFLMMDDSDSMAWDYMPDENIAFGAGRYGAATSQCNGVYYNPKISYAPPILAANIPLNGVTTVSGSPIITYNSTTAPQVGQVVTGVGIPAGAYITSLSGSTQATLNVNATASGTGLGFSIGSYPKANFYGAYKDGYIGTSSGIVNLNTSFVDAVSNRSGDPAQTAFYYMYSGTQNSAQQRNYHNFLGAFYNECLSTVGSTTAWDGTNPVNTVFTKVVISSVTPTYTGGSARTDCAAVTTCTFAEESQNFANWYSYYHNRLLMMKTSAGLAFSSLSSNFRVGYASINNNTGFDYLGLDQFTSTQRTNWFNKLYSAQSGNSTPLREALAKVGKMYANQLPTLNGATVVDPIQFSCQQNFTILTTDGFWNNNPPNGLPCTNATNCALPNPPGYTLTPSTLPTPGTPGNQDGNVARPQYDGTYTVQSQTQTTETDTNLLQSTSNVQQWTEQNQKQTSSLQSQTGPLQWQTNQQITTATLQWQSNLQHTDATLQWQSNLQHTDATLQWQTNLQHTDAPLQWQTNLQVTTQQQQWSTDQQQTTAPLQWQTKQQQTTASLSWATNLQAATGALQWQTKQQATTGTLQINTSQLQKQITTLQMQTSTLQKQTSQLQSSTSSLQGQTLYLQSRASSDSGLTWGPGWLDVSSCTWITSSTDGTRRQCRYVLAAGSSTLWSVGAGTWANQSSCTTSYDSTTASGGTPANGTVLPSNGSICQYTAYTAYANAASCTAAAQSAGPSYTVGTATQCQTIVSSAFATAASCTATTVPNGSGQTTQCQYTPWTAWAAASSCTAAAQSANPNYTVGTATACQSVVTTPYASAASCTVTTTPSAVAGTLGQTTQCQYAAWTGFANIAANGSCAPAAQSAGPTNYTVGTATQCQVTGSATAYLGWSAVAPACAINYTAGAGGTAVGTTVTTACPVNVAFGPIASGVASCNATLANVQCTMAAATPAYLAYGATCTNSWNPAGTSTSTGGNVTACTTNAAFSTTTPLTGTQSCAVGANVQCSLGAQTTAYLTYGAAACATTYTAGTGGTVGTNYGVANSVITACPVNAAYGPIASGVASCNGATANTLCSTGAATTAYVGYAQASSAPPCTINFNAAGNNTGPTVVTACPTTAFVVQGNIAACTVSAHVQCPLAPTLFTSYVNTYSTTAPVGPTCVIGANNAGLITSACTLNAAFSPVTTVTAGGTCNGGVQPAGTPTWANTIKCVTSTPATTAYVTYAAPTCTISYNGILGTSTAVAGGTTVTTACPLNAAYGGITPLTSGQTCTGGTTGVPGVGPSWGSTVQCPATTGVATSYVTFGTPNCTVDYGGLLGTTTVGVAPPAGSVVPVANKVITACPLNAAYGGTVGLTSTQTCTGGVRAAGSPTWGSTIQCPATTGVSTNYVPYATPNCTVNYGGLTGTTTVGSAMPALSVPPAANKVVTSCPLNGAYGGTQSMLAGQICAGGVRAAGTPTWASTIQCPTTGTATAYVTTYPPTCTTNYNGLTGSTTAPSAPTPGNPKVTTACPTATPAGTYDIWRQTSTSTPTPPLVGAPTSCTPSSTVNCSYALGGWGNVASCTTNMSSGAGAWTILNGTNCQYTAFGAWSDYAGATCTPVAPSGASPYTVGTAQNCRVVNESSTAPNNTPITPAWPAQAWQAVASCTPNAPAFNASGTRKNCQTLTTTNVAVPSCTAGTLGVSPFTTTTCVTNTITPAHGVASCTPGTSGVSPYITVSCNTPPAVNTAITPCIPSSANAGNSWTTTTCSFAGGTYDTLADVAQYYYLTDLRDASLGNNLSGAPGYVGTDISTNNVPQSAADTAQYQHMTTFTMGLGASGRMVYNPNYLSATASTDDYFAVANGSTANGSNICSWQLASSQCNWPIPKDNAPENIDDLWHAAVDGRGLYFSAANPSDLASGLNNAFVEINKRSGSAAAATTSTAFITQGDNFLFSSNYSTVEWTGELTRQQIDPLTGAFSSIDWYAQAKLDAVIPYTLRTIYTYDPTNTYSGNASKLKLFTYTNLTATEKTYFNLVTLPTLSQFNPPPSVVLPGSASQTSASGAPLVNFIKGDRTNEGTTNTPQFYRQRTHVLGDIVDSEALYIKTPPASYSDPGFSTFKTSAAITNRNAMVYVGANDGMLHAFRAADDPALLPVHTGGQEDWAYIPSMVMPDLFNLADKAYYLNHHYYVDGSPVMGDVCVSNCSNTTAPLPVWKTILVGGLNGAGMQVSGHNGGMGYYALDVTDPANPKALWEFTNVNMGYTFGNPQIVKLNNSAHTWVVVFASGYDNGSANTSGDGQGHLFVVNASTGALISDISTGVGTPASPSGLARIDTPVTSPGYDATAIAVYGGDLEGNVWRFDINGNLGAAGYDAQLLATLKDASGNAQPITAKPLVTLASGMIVVNVGTGRYLGSNDKNTTGQDSFYAIRDMFPTTSTPSVAIYGNPRTYAGTYGAFVQQTQTSTLCPTGTPTSVCTTGQAVYVSSNYPVNFHTNGGWYIDFNHLGERDNTDPAIMAGTLVIATNLPISGSCSFGGDSYLYELNYLTGGAVTTSNGVVGTLIAHELTSRSVLFDVNGLIMSANTLSSGSKRDTQVPQNPSSDGVPRRISWRELIVK